MATHDAAGKLGRWSNTDLALANPAEDVRGRKVVAKDGENIVGVNDLFLDQFETKVRSLEVASGGFLGLRETKFLIPTEDFSVGGKHSLATEELSPLTYG